jgi:hypothetical protein
VTEYEELVKLIKQSNRTLLEPSWLDEELFAIKTLGMAGNVLRMIKTGKKFTNNHHSSVAYLLGITDYSPIQRPPVVAKTTRIEPPDIDIDFEDRRRDEIKDYLINRWKNVASISTISKFSAKGMIRDLCRVFAIPLADVNAVCKHFETLEELLTTDRAAEFRRKYPEIIYLAKKFEGRWRFSSVHAAGMVIADRELNTILPLESRTSGLKKKRIPVTAYDMDDCQSIGLIKMDILGIAALSVIADTLSLIHERHKISVDLDTINLNDPEILQEFSLGHTVGIFQTEAQSYTRLLKLMGVDTFEDLVASNALVRPGPLLTATEIYIARKRGEEPPLKQHPIIEKITASTHGLFIYQEQLLRALVEVGGFTWTEADNIRKIIGKKRDEKEFKPFEEKWLANAGDKIGKLNAKKLWADFLKFAGYAFGRCSSGDTILYRPTGNQYEGREISIADLYHRLHDNTSKYKSWRKRFKNIGLTILSYDESDGRIRPNKVRNVYYQGKQSIFKIITDDGRTLKVTANHRSLTKNGWMRTDEMQIGDYLIVNNGYEETKYDLKQRWSYGDRKGRGFIDGSYIRWKQWRQQQEERCQSCGGENMRLETSHIDGNHRNNVVENWRLLCVSCHKKFDYKNHNRRKQWQKGYKPDFAKIVSIEYCGIEDTYDVEMDGPNHNFIANGIVTHNSHACCYSFLSYQTMWLKRYYPIEYIYCLMKNEKSMDKITSFVLEAQRMGIDILSPDVNLSDSSFSIEGDAIRYGLLQIKGVGDAAVKEIIKKRPFESYDDFIAKTEKRSCTQRIVKVLSQIGALDNLRGFIQEGNPKEYYYELLGHPKDFRTIDSSIFAFKLIELDSYSDNKLQLICGLVRKVEFKQTYIRVEIADKTASETFFMEPTLNQEMMKEGEIVLAICYDNNLIEYVYLDEFLDRIHEEIELTKFEKFLIGETFGDEIILYEHGIGDFESDKSLALLIHMRKFVVKKGPSMGQDMAAILLYDGKQIQKVILFPNTYSKIYHKLKVWAPMVVRLSEAKDGTIVINGDNLKTINEIKLLKGLS